MILDSPRQRYLKRWEALKNERQSWISHWQELSENIQPRRSRFLSTERNKGDKRNGKIINSAPLRAARILAAGMMSGITSPARPWFRLTTPDPELGEASGVKSWLHYVEERLRLAFARSNLYNCLHSVYEDLGCFGTSAMIVEDDLDDGLRGYNLPVGQYALANSARLSVNTLYRELSMTVAQLVEKFGLENCTDRVQQLVQRNQLDQWIEVVHFIEPNTSYTPGRAGPEGMPFKSCWMETAASDTDGFLREGGYEEFPVLAPRWSANGEDVYGSSPGMHALGDCKALQFLERRKAQVVDKTVNPPMNAPTSMRNTRASLLPGDVNHVDSVSGGQKFEPAILMPPQALPAISEDVREHERRINESFFADLWLMLANSDGREITAREVAERHEEKMLQLGPVLERLQDELLDPLIDRTFAIELRAGRLPPPPEELHGQDLRVEYISVLAQAQKLIGITAIERLASFAGSLYQVRPDALDVVDWDKTVANYADALGVKPDLIKSADDVQAIRQERAKQQAAQRTAEAAQTATQGAKTLSETNLQDDSALTRLMGALGPAAAGGVPQA